MTLRLRALYVAKEISIAKVKSSLPFNPVSVTRETAVYQINGSTLYIYSFGSIVLINSSPGQENEVLDHMKKAGLCMKPRLITEEYKIIQNNKIKRFLVTTEALFIRKQEQKVNKIVAKILAQSVALESYEDEFEKVEGKFVLLNRQLSRRGKLSLSSKEVMRLIAKNNLVVHEIVSRIGVLEKPESAWDSGMIDSLHARLSDEFELKERFQNIHSDIGFVQENYKVFLESLRSRYDARLEWTIIILIAIEVLLFLYDLFWN